MATQITLGSMWERKPPQRTGRGRPGGQATWSGPAACSLPAFLPGPKGKIGARSSVQIHTAIMWRQVAAFGQAAGTEGRQLEALWPQGNSANLEAKFAIMLRVRTSFAAAESGKSRSRSEQP
jgi:hypothetical protein